MCRRRSFLSSSVVCFRAYTNGKNRKCCFYWWCVFCVVFFFSLRLLAVKWIPVAIAFTLPFGNLKKCFY